MKAKIEAGGVEEKRRVKKEGEQEAGVQEKIGEGEESQAKYHKLINV